jgi:hypothetical protein
MTSDPTYVDPTWDWELSLTLQESSVGVNELLRL